MDHNGDMITAATKLAGSFIFDAKKLARPILETPTTTIDLTNLLSKLDKIRATISEAETRHVTDLSVMSWISDLRDLESMAVDILEEFEAASRYSQICLDLVSSTDRFLGTKFFPHPPDLGCLIRKFGLMEQRCDEIAVNRRQFRLRESDGIRRVEVSTRTPTSSFCSLELFGREKELKDVLEFLLCGSDSVSVLPVVGMAGVGKTLFVQHVYADRVMVDSFKVRIWVCVSHSCNVIKITRAIVESVTEQACHIEELDALQKTIGKLLAGKRFLLVLDDLWSFDLEDWDTLLEPLKLGADGSKVIFTSRNVNVAKLMGTRKPCSLECLSDENFKLICKANALKGRDVDVNEDILAMDDHTVQKFKGLPLAAKALGTLLRDDCKVNNYYADELYDSVVEKVVGYLRWSYDRLPPYLKRCFLYCSLFPHGYIFEKNQLVWLWMAQGFILCEKESQLQYITSKGRKYFDELVGLSFFQVLPLSDASEERYVIHDLFHELAYSISYPEFVRIVDYSKLQAMGFETRHSSLTLSKKDADKTIQFNNPFDGQSLRSFLFTGRHEHKHISAFSKKIELMFNVKIAENLFERLKCLRALDLRNTDIARLPDSVTILKHLHYLCLENTKIVSLPESICSLYKLQTLDLKRCYHLKELPQGTRHLLNLQHLDLPSAEQSILQLPSGIGKLVCLEKLPVFYVGSQDTNCKISELESLANLQGEMQISGLANVTDERDAERASLMKKEKLRKLMLLWFTSGWSNSYESEFVENAESVLKWLQPHHNLEELRIRSYRGSKFPEWIESPKFSRLVILKLKECSECIKLPSLGQLPALRHLTIQMLSRVKSIGREFAGVNSKAFPKLESLEFADMYDWEAWSEVQDGDFPCFQSLLITSCPKFKTVPELIAQRKLQIAIRATSLPLTSPHCNT